MAKIQLAGPLSQRDQILAHLQEEGTLHLADDGHIPGKQREESSTAYRLSQLQFAIEFIARIRQELHLAKKKNWRDILASKPVATLHDLIKTLESLDIEGLIAEAHTTSDGLHEISLKEQQLEEQLKKLEPWLTLDISAKELNNLSTHQIKHAFFIATTRHETDLKDSLDVIPSAVWQEVKRVAGEKGTNLYIEVAYHTRDAVAVENVIKNNNAEVVLIDFKENQSIQESFKAIQEELIATKADHQKHLKAAKSFIKNERNLQYAYDALLNLQERELISHMTPQMEHEFYVTGWIPSVWLASFGKKIEATFPGVVINEIKATAKEKPPIVFLNNKFVEPFENVTNTYGKPGYDEIDPSAPLALFFLISFGFALTDAGYGLVIMLLTYLADRYLHIKRDTRKLIRLIFLGGVSTVILGALTGGWFGITLEQLPPSAIKDILLSMKVIDPVSEPIKLLFVALAVGIVQLLFAWVIKAKQLVKQGKTKDALMDTIPWLTFIPLILAWAAASQAILPLEWANGLKWAIYANALVLILTQGRAYKNPLLKVGGGVLSLYGLMGFLSDTLSYSRLLALGLATGIIGFVVNLLAGMVHGVPYVGILLAIVVLIVGHVFNMAINILGAYIHSSRLQFVEFFPKFIEGGGLPYKPFTRISKYVDNPQEFVR